MRARAPGKIVLSGAYAVLEGAPALVAAVDRYVTADTSRPARIVTDEVAQAIRAGALAAPPDFDATPLRDADRKLGLGSSAAILVASLGAALLDSGLAESALAKAVFPLALDAHRMAQGGGSGIDVAASSFGGVLCCTLDPRTGQLDVQAHTLPPGIVIEVYASAREASTKRMLQAFRRVRPDMAELFELCTRVRAAATAGDLVSVLDEQLDALGRLGVEAGLPIVTPDVAALGREARSEGGCFGPSGAGGGDVALFVGSMPSSPRFRARARDAGLRHLSACVGAAGLGRAP